MFRDARFGCIVIGTPGPFAVWVFDVIKALAAREPTRPIQYLDRTDSISIDALLRPIYLTHYPSPSVIEAVESHDFDILVALEDPVDGVAYMMRTNDVPPLAAIRAQSASGVAHLAIGRAPYVRLLDRATDRPARQVTRDIARHLSLPAPDNDLDRLAGPAEGNGVTIEAALAANVAGYAEPLRARTRSDLNTQTIATALDPLAAMARGDYLRPIVWPTEVFLSGDRPNRPAPAVAAVSGPSRTLYYGPYFHLPPAEYRVEAVLQFSNDTKDVPFVLEVHGRSALARARIERKAEGAYRGYFRVQHRAPLDPIEIRLRNEVSATQGEIALIEVRFFPLPAH